MTAPDPDAARKAAQDAQARIHHTDDRAAREREQRQQQGGK